MQPKYPDIEVQMIGMDGNAFAILGRVVTAMKTGNVYVPQEDVEQFQKEAMQGTYDELLQTCMKWITVK